MGYGTVSNKRGGICDRPSRERRNACFPKDGTARVVTSAMETIRVCVLRKGQAHEG